MISIEKKLVDVATTKLDAVTATNPRVSSRSRWHQDRWTLDGFNPGDGLHTICWYPDEVEPPLLQELKYLAACLFVGPPGPQSLKYSNAGAFAASARFLARFMRERSYASLADLDEGAFETFKNYLKEVTSNVATPMDDPTAGTAARKTGEHGRNDPGDLTGEADGLVEDAEVEAATEAGAGTSDLQRRRKDVELDRRTTGFVYLRLSIWNWMQRVGPEMRRGGIEITPKQFVVPGQFKKLVIDLSIQSLSTMEDLPDEVVLPILIEAHRLIGEPAEQVLRLQDRLLSLRGDHLESNAGIRDAQLEALAEERFTIAGEHAPWYRPDPKIARSPGLILQELVRTIREACVIVLAAGIGWRISEAASIEIADRDDDEGLPSCIFVTPSFTRTSEHFFVRGLLSKHRPEPMPEDWLIGARLAGSGAEPMTVRAIRVLERLYRPWRRLASAPRLRQQLIVEWWGAGITRRPDNIHRIRAAQLRESSQEFIMGRVGLKERLEPLVADNPRLKPYADSNGRCVRPHQWRRTFFRLMYRNDPDLLPAISRHFKHVSLAITENGYAPRSPEALEHREAVATSELVALLYERGEGGETPVTGGDKMLERSREVIASIIDGDTLEIAAPRLAQFAMKRDIRLWPAEHGGCLIGLNPDKAACHSRDGQVDWRSDRPNLSRRNPGLCCSCPNLVVTNRNAGFWRNRYLANRRAWLDSGRDPAFRFARDRARQARTILEHLGAMPSDNDAKEEGR